MQRCQVLLSIMAAGLAPVADTVLAASIAVGAEAPSADARAAAPAPISNLEFAAQVHAWRARMARDGQGVADAALLCVNLPAHRAAEEPQCVALRSHLRAQLARTPGRGPGAAGLPERWSLDEIGGWLGRALGVGGGRAVS